MTKLNSIHCCEGFFSGYIQKYPFSLGQKLRMILSSFLSSPPHQHLWVRVSAGAFTRSGIIKSCVVGNLNIFFFIIQCKWNKSIGLSEHDLGYDSRASKIYVTDENKIKKKSVTFRSQNDYTELEEKVFWCSRHQTPATLFFTDQMLSLLNCESVGDFILWSSPIKK